MRNVFSFIALLALAALPLQAQGPQTMDRDSWSGPIAPGSAIRVDNAFGDVRLRHGGSEGNLEVAAILQQLSTDGSKLVLSVEVADDAAVVTIVRYDHEGNPAPQAPRGDKARADLAIMVPEGFPIRVETANGLIEARGVRTDIDLHTSGGTIRVAQHHGGINARSEGGTMEITLLPSVTHQTLEFSSTTGPITVFTPYNNDLDVTLATSGALTTDFSLTVEHHDTEEPNKTATATVGKGGAALTMASKRGDLSLRRLVTIDTDSSK
jgi:hypothetical protein